MTASSASGPQSPLDVPIVHTLYESYKGWNELLLRFPKSQRYSLGQTCSGYLLELLELTLGAAGAAKPERKLELLHQASIKLDTARLLIRLSKDCQCISNEAYLEIESQLHSAGKMLGGWLKSLPQ